MLKEYNDYVQATKEYLRHYHDFQATIDNLKDDIKSQETLLGIDPAAPIAKYTDMPKGGSGELTTIESDVVRRMKIQESIASKKQEVENIERALRKLERALQVLPLQERYLVEGAYIHRKSWQELANEIFLTEKWARITTGKAVKRMAGMIFGSAAVPEQQSLFVFLT